MNKAHIWQEVDTKMINLSEFLEEADLDDYDPDTDTGTVRYVEDLNQVRQALYDDIEAGIDPEEDLDQFLTRHQIDYDDVRHKDNRITLRIARILADISQVEAAQKLGVAQPTLRNWETGTTRFSPAMLRAMCKLYQVKPEDLAYDDESDDQPIYRAR